jgi:hypothetical protein
MITFLLTPLVFGIFFICLAVGVIFSNKRLKGSCGGLANMTQENGKSMCEICPNNGAECDDQS